MVLGIARFIDRAKTARSDLAENGVALVEQHAAFSKGGRPGERLLASTTDCILWSVFGPTMIAEKGDGHGRFPSLRCGGWCANHRVRVPVQVRRNWLSFYYRWAVRERQGGGGSA